MASSPKILASLLLSYILAIAAITALVLAASGCAADTPPEVEAFRYNAGLQKAKLCVLQAYKTKREDIAGPIDAGVREQVENAIAGSFSADRFRELCYCCSPADGDRRCPCYAVSCVVPWSNGAWAALPMIVIWDGVPRSEYDRGEPMIHELLHVVSLDRNHELQWLWAVYGDQTVQAEADRCFPEAR